MLAISLRRCLLLTIFLSSTISAYASEQPCTLHHGGNYYDLSPLKASKDYVFEVDGGRKFFLNVCRGVTTDPWNSRVPDSDGDIAGLIRRDHGDFAIGIVNTTLEWVEGGLVIRQFNGSPCTNMNNVRGSSSIRFICDTSVYAAGKPAVIDKFPHSDDEACHYELEWRTHFACPVGERGFLSGLFVSLVITAMIFFMLYVVVSTLYNRFVLRLRGPDLMPKFTLQHAHELLDVSYEFLCALLDRFSSPSGSGRDRGNRSVNASSHHWTSREEETTIFTADSPESGGEQGGATLPERRAEDIHAQETCGPMQRRGEGDEAV